MAANPPTTSPAAPAAAYWTLPPTTVQAPETVIFLDIDGVLHSLHGEDLFRDTCCANLVYIVRATDASIVLSSSWRVDLEKIAIINGVLMQRGLAPIIDRTLELETRQAEICEWLDRHPGVARWIAIDDLDLLSDPYWAGPLPTPYSLRLRGHFVRTDSEEGLTVQGAEQAVQLLRGQGRPQVFLKHAVLGKASATLAAPSPLRRRAAVVVKSQGVAGLVRSSPQTPITTVVRLGGGMHVAQCPHSGLAGSLSARSLHQEGATSSLSSAVPCQTHPAGPAMVWQQGVSGTAPPFVVSSPLLVPRTIPTRSSIVRSEAALSSIAPFVVGSSKSLEPQSDRL